MKITDMLSGDEGNIRFTGISSNKANKVFVRAQLDSLNKKGTDHTVVLMCKNGGWGQYMIKAPSTDHCLITHGTERIFVLIPDGRVHVGSASGFEYEIINESEGGPNSLKALTCLCDLGTEVWAAGMGRMVYKRETDGKWIPFDNGMQDKNSKDLVAGILAISGLTPSSVYAVGLKGEMWFFDGEKWQWIDSPTNKKLESICCVDEKTVFVGGSSGVLLRGHEHSWTELDHQLTNQTIWSLEMYQSQLYFADNTAIYRMTDLSSDSSFEKVALPFDKPVTCGYLHSDGKHLWSVGERDIIRFDGNEWTTEFRS